MEKIIWTNRAKSSLNYIWTFYTQIDQNVADKIIHEIIEAVENLKFQEQYQLEETLGGNYRRIIVRHFKIIYRPLNNGILIMQVFDTRQNPDKLKIE